MRTGCGRKSYIFVAIESDLIGQMGHRWAPEWNSVPVTLDLLPLFFPRQLRAPFEFLLISPEMFCFDLHY